ncbi:GDP/GTP exchange factor for ARF [Thoreauomyces humboldtii]|nr:GDP/GTP exchange factor for ARF [Thoreauomyces humboldtii]
MQLRGNNDLANADAIFVLSYSGIILNTDLHSRNIRHKMTLDGFFRNVRGLNNGGDFAPEFLTQIYNNIKDNEIVLPEEHEGELSFNYHWKELMKRSETCGPLIKYEKNSCDKDMLVVAWSPILAALSYAFDNAEEELTLQKAIVGFHHCSTIAAYYEISELFDSIIVALSKMTGFLKESRRLPPEILNLDTKKERESKFVDPWCVEVGRNYRSQVAAALMFGLVDEFGTSLLSGWRWVIACVRNMYLHMLLPNSMITAEDFVRGSIVIPRVPELTKVTRSTPATSAKREAGLFSTLSNFLSLSSSSGDDWADYEATPEEIESQRKARHCVASCKIEVLLSDTRFLEEATLKFLIDSLAQASFAQQERGPTEFESATKAEPTEEKPLSEQPAQPLKFDVAAVFLLELLVAINIHNRDRISVTWPRTLQHITTILQTSAAQNIVLIERAVVSLLQLILRVGHKDDIVSQIVSALSLVLTVPQDIFNAIAEQTMSGLLAIFKSDLTIVSRDLHWDVIFNLVARAGPHPEASRTSFEIACILISDKPADSVVNGENFGECVDLLISYAAAARLVPAGMGNASPSVRSASSPLNPGLLAAGSSPGSPVLGSRDNLAARSSANQGAVDQALRALDKLFRLHYAIPGLMEKSDMKIKRGFFEFWLPVLSGLSQQAYHPAREVRQYALAHLQRALLSSELEQGCQGQSSPEIWADCFENVLFPMLDELLRPEMTRLDPMGMDETRMRAAALLCKIFLQYFPHIHEWEDLPQLWGKILELMRKYMQAGGSDYLREGVQESLKNMLLVMSTQGIFQPPSEQQTMTYIKPNLWGPTWEYVDTFLPTLRSELFPTPTTTQQPAGQTSNGIAEPVETQTIEPPRPSLEKPLPVKEVPVEGGSVIMQDDT